MRFETIAIHATDRIDATTLAISVSEKPGFQIGYLNTLERRKR